jgi:hypothetical protein
MSNKTENALRHAIHSALDAPEFAEIPHERRAVLAGEYVWQWAAGQVSDQSNKGKERSDDALRVVLQEAPIHANIVKLARAFQRSPGAIEQVYRWAATPDKVIQEKRPDHAFVAQIKRIAKEVGWEAF